MARFNRLTVFNTILEDGMVPLFYHADIEISQNIAAVLSKGGSHVLEFTNRGDFAIETFNALIKHAAQTYPDLIVGVGTVDDAPTAALFIAHGANFVVGPTFNVEVARLCNRHKIAYIPGCASVNEIATAEEWGAEIIKLFPGEVGGPSFVKAIRGPRPGTNVMPSGGVSPDEKNLRGWFDSGVALGGIGRPRHRAAFVQWGTLHPFKDHISNHPILTRHI